MKWPWRKQAPEPKPLPVVTTAVYGRWLRAQRPPFQWFAELPELEQEALAGVGDGYVENLAIAVGFAVQDPAAAASGIDTQRGDPEAEAELLGRMAAATVRRMLGKKAADSASQPRSAGLLAGMPPPSMAGTRGFGGPKKVAT